MRKRIEQRPIKVVRHPSGRPITSEHVVDRQRLRIPEDGHLTPRLRRDMNTEAIGFTVPFIGAPEDDE